MSGLEASGLVRVNLSDLSHHLAWEIATIPTSSVEIDAPDGLGCVAHVDARLGDRMVTVEIRIADGRGFYSVYAVDDGGPGNVFHFETGEDVVSHVKHILQSTMAGATGA